MSGQTPANPTRRLIVNADDFGLSSGVNRGIIEAHERGILTSTSLMVRQPAVREAVDYARSHPRLGLGLHLDLGEWFFRDGDWHELYHVVDEHDPDAVAKEVSRQIDAFLDMVGQPPTHIDSHQHVHRKAHILPAVQPHAQRLGVVLRHFDPRVRYYGGFYGQDEKGAPYHDAITPQALANHIASIGPGITELACHPGYDLNLDTMYRSERAIEVALLCSMQARRAVDEASIQLINFADLR